VNLGAHGTILRAALEGDASVSPRVLSWLVRTNQCSDLYQWAPERHFDSAPNPVVICQRWRDGLHDLLARAITLSAPARGLRGLVQRWRGLAALGAATHALADFYAHTNWIELSVARGEPDSLAPLLDSTCDAARFPAGLQSGYFSLRYGLAGCPRSGKRPMPPPGYTYCHLQLAKDYPDHGHGADRPSPEGPTFYELALSQATIATRQMWQLFHAGLQESSAARR
jgi:hypothetical protein